MLHLYLRSWRCIMIYIILSVYSTVFASFLHVIGVNYPPRKPFLLRASSRCDYCGEKLSGAHMLPVVSFIFLKGRTSCCNKPMSWSYLAVEVLAPLFVCILYKLYNFEAPFYLYMFIFSLLLILFVSDMLYLHIPNSILSLYLIVFTVYYGYTDVSTLLQQMYQLMVGAVVFIGLYLCVRKGFGFGDIKLLILLCFFLSLKEVIFIFIVAVFSGALSMSAVSIFKREIMINRIPFVPFILFGFLCCPIANDFFWNFFLRQ